MQPSHTKTPNLANDSFLVKLVLKQGISPFEVNELLKYLRSVKRRYGPGTHGSRQDQHRDTRGTLSRPSRLVPTTPSPRSA